MHFELLKACSLQNSALVNGSGRYPITTGKGLCVLQKVHIVE